uniref:Hexosyltransferase n=1 Tax=Acrobeloides nanus TaxID=290746 RepID=A0A914D6Y3_9BILA
MVLCRILPDGVVVRNNESKWYLSNDEYAPTNLGLYCQGLAYIFSMPLLEMMHKNLQRVQYLWMDDWYVTHALLYNSNAIYVDISPHVFPIESVGQIHAILKYSSFNKKNYRPIFGHFRPKTRFKLEDRVQNWKKIVPLENNLSLQIEVTGIEWKMRASRARSGNCAAFDLHHSKMSAREVEQIEEVEQIISSDHNSCQKFIHISVH